MSDQVTGMTSPGFVLCVKVSFEAGMFEQFLRLNGIKLIGPRSPIETMVDKATGFDKEIDAERRKVFEQFKDFVRLYVWRYMPPETKMALNIEALETLKPEVTK